VPDVYIGAMSSELEEFPADVLRETVTIARRTLRFLPSIAEMISIAETLVLERRRMLRNVERMEREHERRRAAQEQQEQRERERRERDEEIGRKLAAVPGAPRLGEFLLADEAMRFLRAGHVWSRWQTADEWKSSLLRGEAWAFTACRLGLLAQQACENPIGPKARIEILKLAMHDPMRAREMFEEANAGGQTIDEDVGRITISPDIEAVVTQLLDRQRIENALSAGEVAA
jgi:hypothetical protein